MIASSRGLDHEAWIELAEIILISTNKSRERRFAKVTHACVGELGSAGDSLD
ncbi:hypothetical protein D3C85_1868100 [compost metagenome]